MWPEDKDLELIFKEGSNKHDHSYDPAAWDQMNAMLDKQRRRKFIIWFMTGALVLLGSWATYHFMNSSDLNESINTEITNNVAADASNLRDGEVEDQTFYNESEAITQDRLSKLNNDQLSNSNSNIAKDETQNAEVKKHVNNAGVKSLVKIDESASERKDISTTTNQISKTTNSPSIVAFNSNNGSSDNNAIATDQSTRSIVTSIVPSDNLRSKNGFAVDGTVHAEDQISNYEILNTPFISMLPILPFLSDIVTTSTPSIMEMTDDKENSSRRKFLISGFAGIESSWTPNAEELSSIDISIGIKTSYLLSDRLAISLGANYRADTYIAGHSDYNAADNNFFEDGIVPTHTAADNDMLEISTGLFYSPSGAHNDGFLLSGQLISNFMLKENYNYNFEDASHNFESSWIGTNNTLISNLEIGFGYRRQLKNGFSADISPYLKIPVNGIGHGKLMLSSYGLRMSVNLGL